MIETLNPNTADKLFAVSSHNPSFRSVKQSGCFGGDVIDFCVPVNLHFPPRELVNTILENLGEVLRHYPDYAEAHQVHIGALRHLAPESIVPANGSTEIITRLCQEADGPLVTSVPTFGRWTDLPVEWNVPLHLIERRRDRQFALTAEAVASEVRKARGRTLVLSNPNNPTGAALPLDDIRRIAAELEDLHSVIIDESFLDFSGYASAESLVSRFPNLIVVKSMGKSLGWHGIRLGYAVAAPERAASLRARLPYWNVNGLAAFVLAQLPRFEAQLRESFTMVARDREYMIRRLGEIQDLVTFPSRANFVFVELPAHCSGRGLRDRLLERHGLLVRETSNKLGSSERYLRIAVHHPEAVESLVSALRRELPAPPRRAWQPPRPAPLTVGVAAGHAGEILQGAIRTDDDRTHRVLLSLPAPVLWTKAILRSTPGEAFSIEPAWASKARDAALQLFARWGMEPPELKIELQTNIPVAKGCGSSTADVLAVLRALTARFNRPLPERELARLIVGVEQAADSSVLSRPAVFRHREGEVEDYLGGPYPPMRVLVVDAEPTHTVDTVSLPRARYSAQEMAAFSLLISNLKKAFERSDPAAVGRVATASARISQRFLPKPNFLPFLDLVHAHQGYGVSVSHSGTVMAALLPAAVLTGAARAIAKAAEGMGMQPLADYQVT